MTDTTAQPRPFDWETFEAAMEVDYSDCSQQEMVEDALKFIPHFVGLALADMLQGTIDDDIATWPENGLVDAAIALLCAHVAREYYLRGDYEDAGRKLLDAKEAAMRFWKAVRALER